MLPHIMAGWLNDNIVYAQQALMILVLTGLMLGMIRCVGAHCMVNFTCAL